MKHDFGQINRILVRGVNWVGDTILSYPAVQQLKDLFPQSHLAILVPSYLADLWMTFPYIDEIIPFKKKKGISSIWEDLLLSRSLKKRNFDLAIILPRSFRSAFHIYLARIPIRMGYRSEGRSIFLTHGLRRTQEVLQTHRIFYYQKLVDFLGEVKTPPSLKIVLREEDQRWAEHLLKSLEIPEGSLLIGINPGATYGLAKCWYSDRFGELGRRLLEKRQAWILLFGKEEERPIINEILQHLGPKGIDLAGKTGLLQLAAILERCHLLVTNDTGTMHLATAVGTPVVALFGPTHPGITGPWGEKNVVVKKEVSCSPCSHRICPTDHRCMKLITVDEVEEIIDMKLKEIVDQR